MSLLSYSQAGGAVRSPLSGSSSSGLQHQNLAALAEVKTQLRTLRLQVTDYNFCGIPLKTMNKPQTCDVTALDLVEGYAYTGREQTGSCAMKPGRCRTTGGKNTERRWGSAQVRGWTAGWTNHATRSAPAAPTPASEKTPEPSPDFLSWGLKDREMVAQRHVSCCNVSVFELISGCYLNGVNDVVSVQAGSQLVDGGSVNILQSAEQASVQVKPVLLQTIQVEALDELLELINDFIHL